MMVFLMFVLHLVFVFEYCCSAHPTVFDALSFLLTAVEVMEAFFVLVDDLLTGRVDPFGNKVFAKNS